MDRFEKQAFEAEMEDEYKTEAEALKEGQKERQAKLKAQLEKAHETVSKEAEKKMVNDAREKVLKVYERAERQKQFETDFDSTTESLKDVVDLEASPEEVKRAVKEKKKREKTKLDKNKVKTVAGVGLLGGLVIGRAALGVGKWGVDQLGYRAQQVQNGFAKIRKFGTKMFTKNIGGLFSWTADVFAPGGNIKKIGSAIESWKPKPVEKLKPWSEWRQEKVKAREADKVEEKKKETKKAKAA